MIIIKNKFHLSIPHHFIISFTEYSLFHLKNKKEKKKINSSQEFKKEVTKKGRVHSDARGMK